MKPIGNWKVEAVVIYEDKDETIELGIYSGHVIDIGYTLSGVQCKYLIFTSTKDDEDIKFKDIDIPEQATARFFLSDVKREWLESPPDVRNAWFQSMFMKDQPIHSNWLVVQTMPYVKIEFI